MIRILDILIALLGLITFAPLLIVCIIILRCTGEKEVFFLQARIGLRGKPFYIIKFATMLKNSPNIGSGNLTLKNDPRVLPFGRILRLTKFNELPQIINILKGDMSIVGPRPVTPNHFAEYSKSARDQFAGVRPGLTGLGSIYFRSEERFLDAQEDPKCFYTNVIVPYKEALELWYVSNLSLGLYLKIIVVTALAVLIPNKIRFFKIFPLAPDAPESLKL